MARYAAPWDRALRVSTVLAAALVVGIAAVLPAVTGAGPLAALPAAIGAVVLVGAAALAPRGFAIEGRVLRIERRVGRIDVPLAAIRAVALLPGPALRGAVRVAGTGGFFGHYGRYWSRALGSFRLYATRTRDLVLVDADTGRFVLSPARPEAFVDELLSRATGAARAAPATLAASARRPVSRRAKIAVALAVAAVPLVVGGTFAASWAFAPIGARVDPDAIRIARNWAAPAEIPLAEVRDVGPLPAAELRGARRVAGAALGRWAYGRFASPALGSFHLYAWRRGGFVRVDTDEGLYVLTPDDPRAFVDDARAALRER